MLQVKPKAMVICVFNITKYKIILSLGLRPYFYKNEALMGEEDTLVAT